MSSAGNVDYEGFFNLSVDLLCLAGYDGYFKRLNPAWTQTLGFTQIELMARPYMDFVHPDDREATLAEAEKLAQGANVIHFRNRYACRDGSYRWLAWSAMPTGSDELICAVARDVTDEVELDRAKDELIAMVSHELRTPLASLVGFSELLLSREFTAAQRKQYLETMLNEGRRLTDLINEFLDLQRMEGGYARLNLGPADLPTLVKRAVATAGENPQTPIEVSLPEDLPLVVADANSVIQVLLNLLSNARKYSPDGGTILVEAKVFDDTVEVSIRDHGLGIPADALPKLFSKFYRVPNSVRRRTSGTGLGLAISRKIIESHGGRVGAESDGLGQGSRFYFTLRAAEATTRSGDVLLVEDDVGFARLLEAELGLKGLSSVWAPDAETADKLIGQMGARAVVLDLLLPGASGEDFLARLRSTHKSQMPVVVVTIQELDATETLALRSAGVVAVLKKHSGAAKEAAGFVMDALTSLGV
jgi:PAS domain S-box-containing protein